MRIAVLHDLVGPEAPPEAQDNLAQARWAAATLRALGHEAEMAAFGPTPDHAARRLAALRPELVFNLVEAPQGQGRLIHMAPLLLERLGLAFTGAGSLSMLLSSHKLKAKATLRHHGLDTPDWLALGEPEGRSAPAGPVIVKSVWEHGSAGLGDDALLPPADPATLLAELARRAPALGGQCFAEAYVDGREFNLSLLAGPGGPRVLPPAEIEFKGWAPGRPRIVGYAAKWSAGHPDYDATPRRFGFGQADAPLLALLGRLALRCWAVFRPRGWARVDFRVDPTGRPWVLEVNANPCLAPEAGFMAAAAQAGLTPGQVISAIVADANRPGQRSAKAVGWR